ncbi:MAG TPA: NADH-quinone oxidoreductase subunit C [Candidatus Sulfotelmatobacter sp.]|nr:NADH-quinone oxidoreductase subunit C [Candidatus Sulfotelmatobacter sp.]
MTEGQTFELITVEVLLDKVQALRQQGYRLVQIGATRLPEQVELNYSFDLDTRLINLRLMLPAPEPRVPSISKIYWAAFLYENELHDLFGLKIEGIVVDFKGNLYKTAVKFPFGTTKAPVAKPAPAKPAAPAAPATPPSPLPAPHSSAPALS